MTFPKLAVPVLLAVLVLAGCLASDFNQPNTNATGAQFGNHSRSGGFANLTSEQRQQFEAQRLQQALAACSGKNEGDACTFQSQFGNQTRTLNGTYQTNTNGTLCLSTRNQTRGPPSTPQAYG